MVFELSKASFEIVYVDDNIIIWVWYAQVVNSFVEIGFEVFKLAVQLCVLCQWIHHVHRYWILCVLMWGVAYLAAFSPVPVSSIEVHTGLNTCEHDELIGTRHRFALKIRGYQTCLYKRIYNLRISYPNGDIIINTNDVKICFRQLKHNPDVIGELSYILGDLFLLQLSLSFGTDFSLESWKVVCHIKEILA